MKVTRAFRGKLRSTLDAIAHARDREDKLAQARLIWLLGELYVLSESHGEQGLSVLSRSIDHRLEVLAPEAAGKPDTVRWGTLYRLGTDGLFAPHLFALTYARAQVQVGQQVSAISFLDQMIEMIPSDAEGAHTLAARLTHRCKLLKAEILLDLNRQDQALAVLGSLRDHIDALPADHATRRRVEHMLSAMEPEPPSLPMSEPVSGLQSPD